MDSDNDSYHSENEFYHPHEENLLQENKNIVNTRDDTSADKKCQQSKTSGRNLGIFVGLIKQCIVSFLSFRQCV